MRNLLILLFIGNSLLSFSQSTDTLFSSMILFPKFNHLMIEGRDVSHKILLIDTFSLFKVGSKGKFDGLEIEVRNHDTAELSTYKLSISGVARKKNRIVIQFFNPANGMEFTFFFGIKNGRYILEKTKYGFF